MITELIITKNDYKINYNKKSFYIKDFSYLWLYICVDDYLPLFVIIDVFGVKMFFVIICNYLFV